MSYWVSLNIDTGGDYPACVCEEPGNMTSNVSGMWTKALGEPLRNFHERSARDSIIPLSEGIERMKGDDWTYRQMAPENGWGSYEGALSFLERLRDACVRNPKARIRVSS